MALLKIDIDLKYKEWQNLGNSRKELMLPFMYDIGKRARYIAKQKYLTGQEINLFPNGRPLATRDKKGVFLIKSSIGRGVQDTTIRSRTMNLFERGRTLRNGTREEGHFVITEKLKRDMMARMVRYGDDFVKKSLVREIRRFWK